MNKEEFLKFLYLYIKNKDNSVKEKLLLSALKHPLWLVMPTSDKSIWEEATKLLIQLEYDVIKNNLVAILEYYQDVNWPGLELLTNYLVHIPKDDLVNSISKVLHLAADDDCWLYGLVSLMVKTETIDFFRGNKLYDKLIIKSDYF